MRTAATLLAALAGVVGFAGAQGGAPPVELTRLPGWKYCGAEARAGANGIRIVQPKADGGYGWVELRVPIDLDRYPEMLLEVGGTNAARWILKIDPTATGGNPEVPMCPETEQDGIYIFRLAEDLDVTGQIDAVVRFFVIGKGGATVLLERLALLGSGAPDVTEEVQVDESAPLQQIDGAGGQADYPLWTIGTQQNGVTPQEIESLLDALMKDGATLLRVGVHGDVMQRAATNQTDPEVQGLLSHLLAARARGFKLMLVGLSPPPETRGKPAQSDEWLQAFVARATGLLAFCKEQGAPVDYFELQHNPHTHGDWWTPDFLGKCGAAVAAECERRGLALEVVGPDGPNEAWAIPWAQHLRDKGHILTLYAGADRRGWIQASEWEKGHAITAFEKAVPFPYRYWISSYHCWGWGSADDDRRGERGPCDSPRYAESMAQLSFHYLRARVSCLLAWELYDVRRIEETAGNQPPRRWGAVKYKTEQWQRRPQFEELGHYFRAMQPGAIVYAAESTGGLLPDAFLRDKGWRIVLHNPFRYAKAAVIKLPTGDWGAKAQWESNAPGGALNVGEVALANAQAEVSVPAYGCGSLVLWPGGQAPPAVEEKPAQAQPPATQKPAQPHQPPAEPAAAAELRRGDLLFEDHFDDGFLNQWQPAKPDTVLDNEVDPPGVLNVVKGGYLVTQDTFPPERIMEFRVKVETPGNFEVCALPWFAEDREEFCQLALTPVGYGLFRFAAGFTGLCGDAQPLLGGGGWHDVAIQTADGKVAFWVDEKLTKVCEAAGLAQEFGRVGFRGSGFKADDVMVYEVAPKKP
jgi:hypothetical protein